MPQARMFRLHRPPPYVGPLYSKSPYYSGHLHRPHRSPVHSLLSRSLHTSCLRFDESKKQSASSAATSSADSDTTQYWRAERIFDRIRQEQEAKQDDSNDDNTKETKKKVSSPPADTT